MRKISLKPNRADLIQSIQLHQEDEADEAGVGFIGYTVEELEDFSDNELEMLARSYRVEEKKFRLSAGDLRKIIKEEIHSIFTNLNEGIYGEKNALISTITSLDPEYIAVKDYIDDDSGEVFLAAGQKAKTSPYHPSYKKKRPSWYMDEEPDFENVDPPSNAQNQYQTAIEMYAADFTGENFENPEGAAFDLADTFFVLHPEWKMWSKSLGISKADMKNQIADLIFNEMNN